MAAQLQVHYGTQIQVIQTRESTSVFFYIGGDGILYATRESQGSSAGWTRQNLVESIAKRIGSSVTAKSFSITQSPTTLKFDLAVVISKLDHMEGDHLYVLLSHDNSELDWSKPPSWSDMSYDLGDRQTVSIHSVELLPATVDDPSALTCLLDVVRDPSADDPLKLLDRYYIDFSGSTPRWVKHTLATDLQDATSIGGWRSSDPMSGFYTMGHLNDETELIFSMRSNPFDPSGVVPPPVVQLSLPDNPTAMARSLDNNSLSTLFVSGTQGVCVWTPKAQDQDSSGVLAIKDSLTHGASQLCARTEGGRTALWGVSSQGQLWYTSCEAGREAVTAQWAPVIPLLNTVESFAFYTGASNGRLTMFAHIKGRSFMSLSQDPQTLNWIHKPIFLPGTSHESLAEFDSFVTRAVALDGNGMPLPDTTISVSSHTVAGVYINNKYYALRPQEVVKAKTDLTGAIMILQEARDLCPAIFTLQMDTSSVGRISPVIMDPGAKGRAGLEALKTADDLTHATLFDPTSGRTSQLVPAGVSDVDKSEALQTLQQCLKLASKLPSNGTRHVTNGPLINVKEGGLFTYELNEVYSSDSIELPPSDIFSKILYGLEKAFDVVISYVEGAWRFICKIGDKIYHALLNCLDAVGHVVKWIFNKIKVSVERLIQYLSFLFDWSDIVRAHKVIKTWQNNYLKETLQQVATVEATIDTFLGDVSHKIEHWANLNPASDKTVGSIMKSTQGTAAVHSPQANWSMHHFTNHFDDAKTGGPAFVPFLDDGVTQKIENILKDLEAMIFREVDIAKEAWVEFRDLFEKLHDLTALDIFKRLAGIFAKFGIDTVRNILVKAIDIFRLASSIVIDLIDTPIEIPILSPLWRKFTKDDLTLLDLFCLVAAVPVVVISKLTIGTAPFPDNETTKKLIASGTLAEFYKIAFGGKPQASKRLARGKKKIEPFENDITDNVTYRVFEGVCDVLAAVGGTGFAVIKFQEYTDKRAWFVVPAWIGFLAPNIIAGFGDPGTWQMGMDTTIAGLTMLKTCVDPLIEQDSWKKTASPTLDIILNACWLAPAIGRTVEHHSEAAGAVDFVASVLADIGGIGIGVMQMTAGTPKTVARVVGIGSTVNSGFVAVGGAFEHWVHAKGE